MRVRVTVLPALSYAVTENVAFPSLLVSTRPRRAVLRQCEMPDPESLHLYFALTAFPRR